MAQAQTNSDIADSVGTATVGKESRVGKVPVTIPGGVQISIDGQSVNVKGPKGEMKRSFRPEVTLSQVDNKIVVAPRAGAGQPGVQFQGLTRALIHNMVQGVSEGYKTTLDLYGVGYRAELKGQDLTLSLGLSHQVKMTLPASIKARVETIDEAGTKRPRLHLESYDKERLGQIAARIRSYRPPEPYKGKGVRYTGERVREKAGKAGKAGK